MEVPMTEAMLEALRNTPEIPDNLLACVDAARSDDGAFVIQMDDDERMAMTEMCEWYIRKDPESGELTLQGELFESIVREIIDADLA